MTGGFGDTRQPYLGRRCRCWSGAGGIKAGFLEEVKVKV